MCTNLSMNNLGPRAPARKAIRVLCDRSLSPRPASAAPTRPGIPQPPRRLIRLRAGDRMALSPGSTMPSASETARGFEGLSVAAFESRMADEMAHLITHHGGRPLIAPSMREIPLEQNQEALAFGERLLQGGIDILILLTGVGTRTLV